MSTALDDYKETLRRLHHLSCLGRQSSLAADKLRSQLDVLWVDLSEEDRRQALGYSEDLFRDCSVHPEQGNS